MDLTPTALTILSSILTAVFGAGIVLGVLKKTVNGSVVRIGEIHVEVREVRDRLTKHIDDESEADKHTHAKIASMETTLNILAERAK